MKLQKCTQDIKNSKKKRRNIVAQVRFCGDMEIQRKLLGRPSEYQKNYFIRDNILLSFTSPVSASKRLRVLMNTRHPSQDKAHVKDTGLSETLLQRAD